MSFFYINVGLGCRCGSIAVPTISFSSDYRNGSIFRHRRLYDAKKLGRKFLEIKEVLPRMTLIRIKIRHFRAKKDIRRPYKIVNISRLCCCHTLRYDALQWTILTITYRRRHLLSNGGDLFILLINFPFSFYAPTANTRPNTFRAGRITGTSPMSFTEPICSNVKRFNGNRSIRLVYFRNFLHVLCAISQIPNAFVVKRSSNQPSYSWCRRIDSIYRAAIQRQNNSGLFIRDVLFFVSGKTPLDEHATAAPGSVYAITDGRQTDARYNDKTAFVGESFRKKTDTVWETIRHG